MGFSRLKMKCWNKKGLEFKLAFFAIIAMGLIVVSVGVWVDEWNDDYDSGLVYDLDEFDSIDSVSSEAGSQRESVIVKSTNTGEEFEGTSIRGVFAVLNNIYAPFRIVFGDGGMLDSVTERFGAPDYIRQALVTLMVIGITFALIAVFFRLNRRSA
jgi:hypothetical protein